LTDETTDEATRPNAPSDEPPIEPSRPQRRRILLKLFLGFCAFAVAGFAFISWYVTTNSFQQLVRARVIASVEKMTGGRVELGELHTIPFRLRVDARNLTIHGREATDQLPLLHVDRVQVEIKIISLLSTTIGMHSLVLEHPVVHMIVYPDGSTNVPTPQVSVKSDHGPVEELFSLSVRRIEAQRGEFLWEDRKMPFDFDAKEVSAGLNYSLLRRRYEARVAVGDITTRIQDYPPFTWRFDSLLILARGRADISKMTVTSGKTQVQLTGSLLDFHNPKLDLNYSGITDLAELGVLLRQKDMQKGTVQFQGKGSWSLQNFSTQGIIQAKEVDWVNQKVPLRNGRINANYSITPSRFDVTSIKANLLGGDLQGDAQVTNWQSSPGGTPTRGPRHVLGKIPAGSLQRGSVHLLLADFPLLPGLEFLSSKKLPLDRLGLSGSVNGRVEMLWVGSINDAETRLNLNVTPPGSPSPSEIPLRGSIDGIYRGSRDELQVSQLRVSTPGSQLTASGNLAATSSLNFSITSHSLREVTPLIQAAYGSPNLPFTIRGFATLTGNATGKLSLFSVTGNLEVYDFDTTLPAHQHVPVEIVHWDALSAAIQFSSSHIAAHNGSFIHGHTLGNFEGNAALVGWTLPENSPLALHLDIRNADVGEVVQVAGAKAPLSGLADLSATVSGTRADPQGDGHLDLRNGAVYGVDVPSLKSDLHLNGGELEFNNLNATAFGAALSGSAAISLSDLWSPSIEFSKTSFRANLAGKNLDIAHLPRVQSGRFSAAGMADFTVRASGTPDRPSLEAHVDLRDLALDQEHIGDFYLDAVTTGKQLDVKAHSNFDKADLNVTGNIALEHDFNSDLTLSFHHLDADWLFQTYLPGKITAHSPVDGTVQVRGPLRAPRELKAHAEIQALNIEVAHVQVQNVGPIRFELADQVVLVEELHLAGSGTDFTAHGRVHLSGAKEIDLQADGSVNMTLLQSLDPKISARGSLGVNLSAGGTLTQPVLQGRLDVKSVFISHNDFPSGLSDLNGTLQFDRDRIQIEKLTGTTGGGTVALTGSATYQAGVLLLDLGATAQGVRLRYPPGVSSTANADLRLTGSSNSAQLSGDVLVTKLAITPGFDFSAYADRSRQAIVLTQNDSLQSHLRLDVHVTTTSELQMQTAIARLSGNADLRVRGTADRPAILGRVEVLEGEISFNGNKYHLERGDVTFANPAKTQPVIDLRATTRVRDYDITVQFRGDASVPNGLKVTWQSEPQLPEADVIALLALGRTQEESAAAQSAGGFGFGGDASSLLINEALNSTVNSRLQRLFGASRVKIDPQGLANENNVVRGPQVTVEQQVASNLTLTYSTNVSVSTQQIIQAEYNVTRNISIVALRDQNGVVSFDFKIRRRKK
jgi:translocation and assembly module TamB